MTSMYENIQPLDDKLLIRRDEGETVTKSGLLLAKVEDRGYPVKGIVVAKGPGLQDKGTLTPVDAEVGDEVYYAQANAVEISDDLSIIGESAIIATVDRDEVIPYWDKVLVELETDGGNTASGIVLLSSTDESFDRGTVVSVGPGFPKRGHRPEMELRVGDVIAFNQFSGVELDLGMNDLRRLFITRESEVHGVWDEAS